VSLGVLALGPVFVVGVLMASNDRIRASSFGLATGAGLVSLFIAHLHRDGSDLDPRPWVVIGIVLVTVGMLGHAFRSRRT
jgi:preprotein translocase subunit Sec61beta